MRTRLPLRLAGALVVAAGLALLVGPGAKAAAPTQSGWWWRPQASALPARLPAPPNVAATQVMVQGQPEGATAVAAARWELRDGETDPMLTVVPSMDSTVPTDAVVLACRASVGWTPDDAGVWEAKPLIDGSACTKGAVAAEGITFALAPLLSGTTLDAVFVAGKVDGGQAGADGSPFTLIFDKPGPTSLRTTQGSSSSSETTGTTFTVIGPSVDPGGSSTGSNAFVPSTSPSPSASAGGSSPAATSFAPAPVLSDPVATAPVEASPTAPVADAPAVALRPALPPQAVTDGPLKPASSSRSRGKTVGVLVLLVGAAAVFWASTGDDSGPRVLGLGRFATVAPTPAPPPPPVAPPAVAEIGGLSRFARPRTGRPPAL